MAYKGSSLQGNSLTSAYLPPPLLEDVHVLDALELSGSQHTAATFLAVHQSTVSRSLRGLQDQLELPRVQRTAACRHGRNACLDLLRLACRAHRVMKGVLRIGTDGLHQGLLLKQQALQLVPPRFRKADQWAELVRLGLLDGAIVSSWALDAPLLPGSVPSWSGIRVEPLGAVPLELMARSRRPAGVLLPNRMSCPLLHQVLERAGHTLVSQPRAAQESAAWLKRMNDWDLALPLCPGLLSKAWLHELALTPVRGDLPLGERLWLLLPEQLEIPDPAQRSLRVIRRRVSRAAGSEKNAIAA